MSLAAASADYAAHGDIASAPKDAPASRADLATANEVYQRAEQQGAGEVSRDATRGRSAAGSSNLHAHPPPTASSSNSSVSRQLPPIPHLFPVKSMTASQVTGEWQLVASSAASWRARRNVRAKFTPRSEGGGEMDAEWAFYEIASFQAKTLLQRVHEDAKAKRAAERRRQEGRRPEDEEQRSGERRVAVSGRMWEEKGGKCLIYRPNRATVQKALGKDIRWEVVSYGTASPASRRGSSNTSSIDWFVAYAHPLPLLHPFISVYFRPEVVRDDPDTVTLLFEDIVDALRHATDPWSGSDEGEGEGEAEEEIQGEADDAEEKERRHSQRDDHSTINGRRGRRTHRGGDVDDDDYVPVTGTGPSGAPLKSLSSNVSGSKAGKGAGTPMSKADKRREDLKWELRRLASEVRPVRGI